MNLRELVDTVDVPETRVAEDVWDLATRRQRRRHGWATAGIGALVVVVVAGVAVATRSTNSATPPPATTSPDPTQSPQEVGRHLPVAVVQPDWASLGTAPWLAPPSNAAGLTEDPVDHAALVMGDSEDQAAAYVLGDDGDWRRLDVPGLVPISDGLYTSSLVVPTSLDPTGTRMAIPQPQALVVVDLTTGASRRYDVPGFLHYAVWTDEDTVMVGPESAHQMKAVALSSGAVENVGLSPASRVLADGSRLMWPHGSGSYSWYTGEGDPHEGTSPVNNSGGFFSTSPLLLDGRGVVINSGSSVSSPPPDYPPVELQGTVGVAAVDLASGDPVGYVQLSQALASKGTSSTLLGWRGEDPVLGLVDDAMSSIRTFVVVWDVDAGTLEPLAAVPSWSLSWGVGL